MSLHASPDLSRTKTWSFSSLYPIQAKESVLSPERAMTE